MGIERLTYLDIPSDKRSVPATKAINRLFERMNETGVSDAQRQKLLNQANQIEKWLTGALPMPPRGD